MAKNDQYGLIKNMGGLQTRPYIIYPTGGVGGSSSSSVSLPRMKL
jgi:hypothetical protein